MTDSTQITRGTQMKCRWLVDSETLTVHTTIGGGEWITFTDAPDEVCRASDYKVID